MDNFRSRLRQEALQSAVLRRGSRRMRNVSQGLFVPIWTAKTYLEPIPKRGPDNGLWKNRTR
jgi:hypothetical protein